MEWAPRRGQIGLEDLTGWPGFRRMKAHGEAPLLQHRVQTSGRAGVSRRRALHALAKRQLSEPGQCRRTDVGHRATYGGHAPRAAAERLLAGSRENAAQLS